MAVLNEYLQNKAKAQNAAAKTEFQKFASSTESAIAELERHIKTIEQQQTVTDKIGNKYRQEIGEDGTVRLVLIESYNGELFE